MENGITQSIFWARKLHLFSPPPGVWRCCALNDCHVATLRQKRAIKIRVAMRLAEKTAAPCKQFCSQAPPFFCIGALGSVFGTRGRRIFCRNAFLSVPARESAKLLSERERVKIGLPVPPAKLRLQEPPPSLVDFGATFCRDHFFAHMVWRSGSRAVPTLESAKFCAPLPSWQFFLDIRRCTAGRRKALLGQGMGLKLFWFVWFCCQGSEFFLTERLYQIGEMN